MDKDRIAAAVAARGEQIKTASAEYLWICCGIKPPPLPDKPVVVDPSIDPTHLQLLRPLNRAAPATRERP
jgi:hypothetical protein